MRPTLALTLAPALAGCLVSLGCRGADTAQGLAGDYPIGDGVSVVVAADGSFALTRDGAVTFATASGQPLRSRVVEETVESSLGMWRFTRDSEQDIAFGALESVRATGATVTLRYGDDRGRQAVLDITRDGEATTLALRVPDGADAISLPVACDPDGSFHGWGEQYSRTDQRGHAFRLFLSEQGIGRTGTSWAFSGDETTTYFPMPYYLDARGFGVLFETDHRANVDLCAADPDVATIEVMAGDDLAWRVFDGPTPLDVVRQLGDVVGRPKAPPAWAHGAWMCMQGGEARVREQVDAMEAAGIPATVLWVQDWTGRRENPGGGYGVQYRWEADTTELYPDISAFFAELHDRGYKIVGYMNPFVDPALQHWADMEAGGMLPLHPETGEVYTFLGPRGDMTTADLSNPATRAYIQDRMAVAVDEIGLDGWMADFAEWLPIDADLHSGEDAAAAHNTYPEAWQRLTREVMDDLRPDGDWLMFARSGWTGVHDVAMVHWVGDQEADWEHTDGLPTVVPAMLTLSMSGQPFVTHDVAGFSGGPSTEELYLRWTELGAFSPFFRTHDGNERDRNWRWDADPDTTAHFARMARIHAALAPELQALSDDAAETGAPIVRHLLFEFPDDPETWALSDQFLLGPDLLVAPILEPGATAREVYVPAGDWFDVWTGASVTGPAWITADGPIGQPPVFSRGADRADLRAIE